AAAEGVALEMDFLREINAAYAGSRNMVSMRQDLLRGRTTEIDYLNGAVAELGQRHGLKCPVNKAFTSIIKGMEAMSPMEPEPVPIAVWVTRPRNKLSIGKVGRKMDALKNCNKK